MLPCFSLTAIPSANRAWAYEVWRIFCDQLFRTRFAPFELILYAGLREALRHVPQPWSGCRWATEGQKRLSSFFV